MLTLLSPAKKLDFDTAPPLSEHSQPGLLDDTALLLREVRKLDVGGLKSLMGISDNLATLNHERFRSLSVPFTPDNAKPAMLAFWGDVYQALDAGSLTPDTLRWAQDRVVILSGLYGALRPLDLMQPYRLEMGTRLANPRGANLYAFWRDTLTPRIQDALREQGHTAVLNLASAEYSKAVRLKDLDVPVITPAFQDVKDGKARTLFLFAKRARGWMTRFVLEERISDPEQLKRFSTGGYAFDADASDGTRWVFRRPQPPPVGR